MSQKVEFDVTKCSGTKERSGRVGWAMSLAQLRWLEESFRKTQTWILRQYYRHTPMCEDTRALVFSALQEKR